MVGKLTSHRDVAGARAASRSTPGQVQGRPIATERSAVVGDIGGDLRLPRGTRARASGPARVGVRGPRGDAAGRHRAPAVNRLFLLEGRDVPVATRSAPQQSLRRNCSRWRPASCSSRTTNTPVARLPLAADHRRSRGRARLRGLQPRRRAERQDGTDPGHSFGDAKPSSDNLSACHRLGSHVRPGVRFLVAAHSRPKRRRPPAPTGSRQCLKTPREEVASFVSVPATRRPRHGGARWETIRYAIDDTARTIRLCLILLVTGISAAVGVAGAVLMHYVLMMLLARK